MKKKLHVKINGLKIKVLLLLLLSIFNYFYFKHDLSKKITCFVIGLCLNI